MPDSKKFLLDPKELSPGLTEGDDGYFDEWAKTEEGQEMIKEARANRAQVIAKIKASFRGH